MEKILIIIIAIVLGGLAITNAIVNWISHARIISGIITNVYKTLITVHRHVLQYEDIFIYTGIISANIRLKQKHLSIQEIVPEAVRFREELISPWHLLPRVSGYGHTVREKNKQLLNLIVRIERLIFKAEHPEWNEDLVLHYLKKRIYEIEYTMARTLKRSSIPKKIITSVQEQLNSLDKSEIDRAVREASE